MENSFFEFVYFDHVTFKLNYVQKVDVLSE